jgi:hypothetical protein
LQPAETAGRRCWGCGGMYAGNHSSPPERALSVVT